MKKTFLIVLFALNAFTGMAQVKSGLDLCMRDEETGEWLIGLYDDFAVYDCQFWDYERVEKAKTTMKVKTPLGNKSKESLKAKLVLKQGKKRLEVELKKNILSIDGIKHQVSELASKYLPDYPKKDTCSTFKDTHYQTDTVTLVGWLKNMSQEMKDKGNEYPVWVFDDIFTGDYSNPNISTGKIDSLGRFMVKIPMINSAEVTLDIARNTIYTRSVISTIFEPGETYFLLNDFNSGQRLFMGKNCRLQNELQNCKRWGFHDIPEKKMDEEAAIKFFENMRKHEKENTDNLQQIIAEHPTLSDRYINYIKGNINAGEGFSMNQGKHHVKDRRIPMPVLNTLGQQIWQRRIRPYTLYNNFKPFLSDYINQYVSRVDKSNYRQKFYASILRKYRDAGKVTITDKELAIIDNYAKTHKGFDEYNEIVIRKDISQILFEDEVPMYYYYCMQSIMDSIGCDQDLRDILITQRLYFENIQKYDTLTNCMMQFVEENVKMPAAKAFLKAQQEKLLTLKQSTLSYAASIKSAEDLVNMTDGEKMLRKILEPYKGKLVLLDVWGTWCSPCKQNLSHSQEEYERLKDYDIVYLYLANNSSDEAWKNVIKQYNVMGENVVHYNLPQDQQQAIENFIGLSGYPTYKLFDREGNLLDLKINAFNLLNDLEELLKKLK